MEEVNGQVSKRVSLTLQKQSELFGITSERFSRGGESEVVFPRREDLYWGKRGKSKYRE